MCDVLRRYLYILQTTVTKYHCCVNLLVHKYEIFLQRVNVVGNTINEVGVGDIW